MTGHPARSALANVVGALALVVGDELGRSVREATGETRGAVADAAALSALAQFMEGASVDRIHRVLGLTPSGAVRLLDRLEAAGLVVRGPGDDGRTRAVRLTEEGRRRASRVRDARSSYLSGLVDGLDDDEVDLLRNLLARLATQVVEAKDGGAWTCRLCDLTACGRERGECPTANAARAKYGDDGDDPPAALRRP